MMVLILVFFFVLFTIVGTVVWTVRKKTLNDLSLGGIILMGKTLTEWGIGDVPLLSLYEIFTDMMVVPDKEDFVDPLKVPLPQHETNVLEKLKNSTASPAGTVFIREVFDNGVFYERRFELAYNTLELTSLMNLILNSSTTDALVCAFKPLNLKWENLTVSIRSGQILLDQVLSVRLTDSIKEHVNSIPMMNVPDVFYFTSTAMLGISQDGAVIQFPKGGANIAADKVTNITINDFSTEITNMLFNVFLYDVGEVVLKIADGVALTRTPENLVHYAITEIFIRTLNQLGVVGTMPNSSDVLPGESGFGNGEIRFITRRIADMFAEA